MSQSQSETTGEVIEQPVEGRFAGVDVLGISTRLNRRPDWTTVIEPLRTQMMGECRKLRGMSKAEAQAWTYSELDRLYPPTEAEVRTKGDVNSIASDGNGSASDARTREGRIAGLADVPPDWPPLPSNASLAAEVSWVQSNRLAVVEEQPSGSTVVHLDRARSPAPSWAALGWLETSIRSYAKYVDVAAKATAQQEDEREHVRREKLAIEEVRSLLAEMLADG